MVSQQEKQQMQKFLEARIEETEKFNIQKSDTNQLYIAQKKDLFNQPADIQVVLHTTPMTQKQYGALINKNNINGVFTAPVFYNDRKNFLVSMARKGSYKDSLTQHSDDEIKNMIHLRALEKMTLNHSQQQSVLTYYQPQTPRLEESLRGFRMKDVNLDYSHINERERFKPQNTISKDFKIAEEQFLQAKGELEFYQARPRCGILSIRPK